MAVDVGALYAEHSLTLVRMAVLLVDAPAAAEDVVHDAFLALQANSAALRDERAALTYLRRCTINGSWDVLRRRRTVRHFLAGPHHILADSADEVVLLRDEHRRMLILLRGLPQRDQEVLVLRYWCNLSEVAISRTLGVSTGTVKSTASRALRKIERALRSSDDS